MDSKALDLIGWFRRQSPEVRDAIAHAGRRVTLAAGQTAYLEGDEDTGLWIVLSGLLRLEMTVGSTRDALVGLAPAGMVFGRSHRGGALSRIVSARAARASEAFLLSDHAIERIGAAHPAMWRALGEAIQAQLDATLVLLAQSIGLPPRARIAARLVQLTGLIQDAHVPVTQEELAEMSGLSRKTVNQHLRWMAAQGMVTTQRRAIIVDDVAALMALVEDDER